MHPYVLIPLLSAVGLAALASAIGAREPGNRGNQLAALLLSCAGFWSVCDVLRNTSPDPEAAAAWARLACIGSLTVGPVAFHLLLTLQPGLRARLPRLVPVTYAAGALCVVISLATDWVVAGVRATTWGWLPVVGPGVSLAYVVIAGPPVIGVGVNLLVPGASDGGRLRRSPAIELTIVFAFVVSTLTEFALPSLGIDVPRMGAAAVGVWGAVTWWNVYRFRDPILDPQLFARDILEILPEGVLLVRPDGRVRLSNARFGELAGRPPLELIRTPVAELLEDPADGEAAQSGERECELVMASGARLPVSVATSVLADEDGQPIGYVLAVRDDREVSSLRAHLLTSGRLAAVGQLAAGIAHEINNPVAYVGSNVRLLERHWDDIEEGLEPEIRSQPDGGAGDPVDDIEHALGEGRELMAEVREGIERVAAIVRDVGGFSRGGSAQELVDLAVVLDTTVRVAAPQLRRRATIERCYGEISLVPCVPQELMQVFLNILLNAVQSMEQSGTIRLSTETAGGEIAVKIEDDGPGIPPEVIDSIFDPFFTTKRVGEGTGLGLAISRQIVERHGGRIEVESEPGAGTCFRVVLPAPRTKRPPEATARETRPGREARAS